MSMQIEQAVTTEEIAALAAERLAAILAEAVEQRGQAHLAVSGGHTPGLMFAALATRRVPWRAIHLWQVDERVVARTSAERNLVQLRRDLVAKVPVPDDHVHAMPVDGRDLEAYAAAMVDAGAEVLDAVHLGLGDDGHTASWPPHDPVLRIRGADVAVVGPFHGLLRMTLTPPAVNRARNVLFLVTGRDKAQVVAQLLGANQVLPASRVRNERTVLCLGGGAEAGAVAWRGAARPS